MKTMGRASTFGILMPLVLVVAIVGIGVAWARTAGSGQINACVGPAGFVRVVREGVACRPNDKALVWNVRGPAGPPGPNQLNVTLREHTLDFTAPPGDPAGITIDSGCNPGEVVVGGGITARDEGLSKLTIVSVGPFFDGTVSGWQVNWVNNGTVEIRTTATVAAECVPGTMSSGT
jgi:hypothetical protein